MRELLLAHHLINEITAALRMSFAHMVRPPAAFFQNPYPVPPDLLLYGPRSMKRICWPGGEAAPLNSSSISSRGY